MGSLRRVIVIKIKLKNTKTPKDKKSSVPPSIAKNVNGPK